MHSDGIQRCDHILATLVSQFPARTQSSPSFRKAPVRSNQYQNWMQCTWIIHIASTWPWPVMNILAVLLTGQISSSKLTCGIDIWYVSLFCIGYRSMLPDVVEDFAVRHPSCKDLEPLFFSCYAFCSKLAGGLSVGISTMTLQWVNLPSTHFMCYACWSVTFVFLLGLQVCGLQSGCV